MLVATIASMLLAPAAAQAALHDLAVSPTAPGTAAVYATGVDTGLASFTVVNLGANPSNSPRSLTLTSTSCTGTAPNVTCTLSSVAPGQTHNVELSVTFTQTDSQELAAVVSYAGDDPNATKDSDTLDVDPVGSLSTDADLALTITDAADPFVRTAGSVEWTVRVDNDGPATATGVSVAITLPATGGIFAGTTPSRGSCTPPASGVVTCALGGIASGSAATVRVRFAPTVAGIRMLSATASNTSTDPSAGNNADSETTLVTEPDTADLGVAVSRTPATLTTGGTTTWTATVSSNGPDPAAASVVDVTIASGLSFVSVSLDGVTTCTQLDATHARCLLGGFASGAPVRQVVVVARANVAGTHVVTFDASTSTIDGVPTNDAASASVVASDPPPPTPPTDPTPSTTPTTPTPPAPPVADPVPTPTPDETRPVAKILSATCSGRTALRTCVVKSSATDAVGVTRVQLNTVRSVRGGCIVWNGRAWSTRMTCVKARNTWVTIRKVGTAWPATLTRTARGQVILRLRADDAAGNVAAIASRVLKV